MEIFFFTILISLFAWLILSPVVFVWWFFDPYAKNRFSKSHGKIAMVIYIGAFLSLMLIFSQGIEKRKVQIIRLPGIPSKLLKILPLDNPTHDVVYIGRIVQRKGLHVLLKALSLVRKEMQEIKATIAGPADHNYLRKLVNLMHKLGLQCAIEIKEPVSESRKYEVIRQHKVFVLPSLRDYTPNIILEAQALGVPVIASRVGAVPKMMIEGETGLLVEPDNDDDLAEAIKKILFNGRLRKRMSIRAKEFAENFTLEKQIDSLESLYKLLLGD